MSSSSDTAGAKAVVAAANKKGGQLTSAETASVLSGVNRSGGGSSYSPPSQVTDMSQWYRDTQAAQGYKPTADQVSAATQSYKEYVAGKTNPNSGLVWNQYGEVIGNTGTGKGGYTDFSWQGANAYVDPNRIWNADARSNPSYQRVLMSTPLTGNYLDYNTNTWGQAPEEYRNGFPGFINYAQLGNIADMWLQNNPGSFWDRDSLVELWQGKYQDISAIPNMMNQYAHEFANGIVPSNFQYNPNSLYGDARTGAVAQAPLYPGATPVSATASNTVNQPDSNYLNDSNWVGNVFPGAQWNDTSRTISVPGGGVLQEGVDFVIGQDNRAYVLPSINANITPNLTPALTTTPTTATAPTGVPNTGNEWHNLWKDMQNQYAEAMPAFNPPAREDFRFLTPPQSISSSGDDVHTPTLAARQQWENEQNALQDQYAKQYGVNYQRAQDIYNTQLDWLKTGMLEQQRQEQVAAEAAKYQTEQEIERERVKYNRAWAMFEAGVPNEAVYAILGITPGTKTLNQILKEKEMELAEREYALSATKAAKGSGSGSTGGSGGSQSPNNPFNNPGGGQQGDTIRGFKITRLDEYISTQRARLKTPEAVAEYVKNTKLLNSDFKQAVLTRLNHHLAS
jgi:hypothetical protein